MDVDASDTAESPAESEPKVAKTKAKAKPAPEESRDVGDWKFSPWEGVDHWVNQKTRESTFDLKKVQLG